MLIQEFRKQHQRQKWALVKCDNCGKIFERLKKIVRAERNFCDRSCQGSYPKKRQEKPKKLITVECNFCHRKFLRLRHLVWRNARNRILNFCSRSCRSKYTQKINPHHPPSRSTSIELTCNNCGEKFFQFLSHIKTHKKLGYQNIFCSLNCRIQFKRSKTGFHSTYLTPYLRKKILERDEYICQWCKKMFDASELHIDHEIPISCGGGNELDNLRVLCTDCHHKKRPSDFRILNTLKELEAYYVDQFTKQIRYF